MNPAASTIIDSNLTEVEGYCLRLQMKNKNTYIPQPLMYCISIDHLDCKNSNY